ncbi:type II toxin-antitoxin system VapC family toxin [Caulobacter mirabilis]|uniref:PIN domain nuclease n=1 Tax=Caulobacter mirabilis TaxID=69666 RepID=A0A2D2B219_9CAUL|nr:type II toxin-antitoxin system VapC family toxin [Caulobacter mirabilis]ATQ44315.1 PIN domain nuclease [Caulobacter mirabilis]
MKLLLDTHVLVRSAIASRALPMRVLDALRDPANQVLVSAASAYEIEYKRPRDPELQRLPSDLAIVVDRQQFTWLDISWEDARDAGLLPRHHRDPFDRLLVAQAQRHGATLVSADRTLPSLGVSTFW